MTAGLVVPASAAPADDLEVALGRIGVAPADLDVRPERWSTRLTLPPVEEMLKDPLKIPGRFASWLGGLEDPKGGLRSLALAAELAGAGGAGASFHPGEAEPPEELIDLFAQAPEGLQVPLASLLEAVADAQTAMKPALDSLPEAERERVLGSVNQFLLNEPGRRVESADFEAAGRFDHAAMLAAALRIDAEVQAFALGPWPALPRGYKRRFKTPEGDVLVAGPGDRVFLPKDLVGVVLLVAAGGKSRYEGPVAAAGPGEIRVVIDLSPEVTIDSPGESSAGSGLFGIGLLYLPDERGRKTVRAGDRSLGAGLFGVGGAFIAGTADLETGRFSQGAGAFGAGVMESGGEGTSARARSAAQGFGFTRGAGIFVLGGSDATIECGLSDPDPREPLATISLCQGVGYGPRAFAGGGVGLARLEGDRNKVRAGYFAQGAGYWHSFGGFKVKGNGNRIQARRYDQGSGVHVALGAMAVEGDENQVMNWGVGPAYGWDFGAGYFEAKGDRNSFYAEWGTGHGDVNGHALARIVGKGNRLSLPDFGTGALKRFGPGYGAAVVTGEDNVYRLDGASGVVKGPFRLSANPWGTLEGDGGLSLDPLLALPKPLWPEPERGEALARERKTLAGLLEAAEPLPPAERYGEWLSIASSFSVDEQVPGEASRRLFALAPEESPRLAALISSDHFMEFIWLRPLLAAMGGQAAEALKAELAASSGTRRVLVLGSLRYFPVETSAPESMAGLKDPDWRVRREAAMALGYLFDREQGDEPGRLVTLEAARDLLAKGADMEPRLGTKRLADLVLVLALDPAFSAQDRAAMLAKSNGPREPVGKEGIAEFARILGAKANVYREAVSKELEASKRLEPDVRKSVAEALEDTDRDVLAGALAALGQNGHEQDAQRVAAFLDQGSAYVREAAAAALAAMGPSARETLRERLGAKEARTRAMAAKAAAQSWDAETVDLLHFALRDDAPEVQAAALSGLFVLQGPLASRRSGFAEDVRRLADSPDASVRAAVQAAARLFPR